MAPRRKKAASKGRPGAKAPSADSVSRVTVYIVKQGNWYQAETGRTRKQGEAKRFKTKRGAAQWAKSRGGRVVTLLLAPKTPRKRRKKEEVPASVRPPAEPRRRRKKGDKPSDTERLTRAQRHAMHAASTLERGAKSVVNADLERSLRQAEMLAELAKQAEKQQKTEDKNRAKALKAWQTGKKPRPSPAMRRLFREEGFWQENADGTATGELRLVVPHAFQCDWDTFRYWLGDWEMENDFLKDEPVWYSVGLQISGVERDKRKRYDRIHGRVGITSYWARTPSAAESFIGGKRVRLGVGLGVLLTNMRESVAKNVIDAGRCIYAVVIFAHWGPYAPVF